VVKALLAAPSVSEVLEVGVSGSSAEKENLNESLIIMNETWS
jgi:hypothetical protein